jgi:hypothetical protein
MRNVQNSAGTRESTEQQHKEKFEGYLKLDKEGRYTLHASVSSGYYFTRAFAETGWGGTWYGERGANMFVRQLYFQAEPITGIQFQYGSLPILRGSTSEDIGYDEDGYIAGERLSIKRPKQLFFDDISVTYAYLGDYYRPNLFNRLDRFQQSNYHQFLIAKRVGRRVSLSADLTHHGWSETVRAGAIVDTHESKVFDSIRVGMYERYSNESGHGFEASVQHHLGRRVVLMGGFVSVDKGTTDLITPYDLKIQRTSVWPDRYAPGGNLNADRFARGDSPYGSVVYKANSMLSFNAFITGDNEQVYSIKNSRIILVGMDFDLRPVLAKCGLR